MSEYINTVKNQPVDTLMLASQERHFSRRAGEAFLKFSVYCVYIPHEHIKYSAAYICLLCTALGNMENTSAVHRHTYDH
jgi:hypothetical protein